jgi:hypothetical protein
MSDRVPNTPPDPALFGDYQLLDAGEERQEREKKMTQLLWILSGGWARGYRTQALGYVTLLGAFVAWAVGDMSMADLVDKLPGLLTGAGLVFVGDKINDVKAAAVTVAAKK